MLATFNGANGQLPMGDVAIDASGNFFGATISGGSSTGGPGVVYEVVKGSKTITDLVAFNGSNGDNPFGGVTLDSNGNLFGTTQSFSGGAGEVFEIAKGTKTAQILATFHGLDGAAPQVTVKFDANGNLFGATFDGGLHGDGNVFKLTPTITLTAPANQSTSVADDTKIFTLGSFVETGAIAPLTATVNWGDGSVDDAVRIFTTSGTINARFVYIKTGVHTVTVTVSDSAGHISNTVKFNISVSPDIMDGEFVRIIQQPTTGTAGASLSPTIKADIEDRFGNVVTTDSSNVTLSLATLPTGGKLAGTTTVKAVKGVATFTGLSLKVAGVYTLKATDGAFTAAVSNSITIVPAAAAKLAIVRQPTAATAGVTLSPSIIVDIEDAFGNIVATDASNVTLALSIFPPGGTLAGTTTVKAVKGVASLKALILSKAGTYVVKAVDGGLTAAISKSIVVK